MGKMLNEHKTCIELNLYPRVLAYAEIIMWQKGKVERLV